MAIADYFKGPKYESEPIERDKPEPTTPHQVVATKPHKVANECGDYAELWAHHPVGVLIRRTKDYIVHINQETNRLDWGTSERHDLERDKLSQEEKSQYHAICGEVAILESRPNSEVPPSVLTDFRVLLGEALVCAFENDFAMARRMLISAEAFVNARGQELSRRWYLSASLACALPCAAFALVLWGVKDSMVATHGETVFWLLLSAMAGAVGALFSVILRTGRLHLDWASGRCMHNLEAFSRVLAGSISGVLVALGLKAELIVHVVLQPGKENHVIVLLAMASGVSERYVVSLIQKFEKEQKSINFSKGDS